MPGDPSQSVRASIVAVIALLALMACEGGPSATPGNSTAPGAGTVAFEILQWRCRHANAITATETIEAEGEFCFVALDIENQGSVPVTLDPSCQFLIDDEGNRYTPDLEVMALDELAGAGFGQEIGPGVLVENSALYYDVPKLTHPDALELHETCDDSGVVMPLTASAKSSSEG